MRPLLFTLLLLMGCGIKPPAESEQEDLVRLPGDLRDVLKVGETVDFGHLAYTRLNDSMAVRSRPPAPTVKGKCKNCFNQVDNSKVKDKSEHTAKIKPVYRPTIKPKVDNSHRVVHKKGGQWVIFVALALVLALYLFWRFIV
jgi:hypothetical protein